MQARAMSKPDSIQTLLTADWNTDDFIAEDKPDLDWATVLKRTFESFLRGERPNMYGEWVMW